MQLIFTILAGKRAIFPIFRKLRSPKSIKPLSEGRRFYVTLIEFLLLSYTLVIFGKSKAKKKQYNGLRLTGRL